LVSAAADDVVVRRVPNGGIKASAAVDASGLLHLVYFRGSPQAGDAFYVTSQIGGETYSQPIRVNSEPGAVLGASSARGPHMALGRDGKVHVLWAGSSTAKPRGPLNPAMAADSPYNGTPLLYARLDSGARAFTVAKNLMTRTTALDGDSSIAGDSEGHVYVAWHAQLPGGKGEEDRRVWLARSDDDGNTFADETDILPEPTGACACCGLTITVGTQGSVAILYRVADAKIHRGMRLLLSRDGGRKFTATSLDDWEIAMCPMSTAALLPPTDSGLFGAWENQGRIFLASMPTGAPIEIGPRNASRKHPSLARNSRGEYLAAWTEGISFGKGGNVGWQRFDSNGKPMGSLGRAEGLPGNGNVAAVALADDTFAVVF
jgi:hypothetical protein